MTNGTSRQQPGCWARVRLVQGQSELDLWNVTDKTSQERISVGSGSRVDWQIHDADVASEHFQLLWDGTSLWVSRLENDRVLVDGEPVTDWRQLPGRSRIDFGKAAMLVETSSAAVSVLSMLEPLPDSSIVTDFVDENEVVTHFFEGTYDFENGNHQPAPQRVVPIVRSFGEGYNTDVQTVVVDTPVNSGEVPAPFKGRAHPRPSKKPPRILETALGSRFARPDLSNELKLPNLEFLQKINPTPRQLKIGAAACIVVVLLSGFVGFRAHRQRLADLEQRASELAARQQAAQDAIAQRYVAVRHRIDDEERAASAAVSKFLDDRRIHFVELRARQEAIAHMRRRKFKPEVIDKAIQQERLLLEQRGADLLFANDFEGALPHYRNMAAAYPDEPSFAGLVEVLRAKLRCREGKLPTGEPCR